MSHLLIVEDDVSVRRLLSVNLAIRGYKISEASTLSECYEILEKNLPQLIVLDLLLPEEQGEEFLEICKNTPQYLNIPVIIITGMIQHTQNGKLDTYKNIIAIFNKPFSIENVMECIIEEVEKVQH